MKEVEVLSRPAYLKPNHLKPLRTRVEESGWRNFVMAGRRYLDSRGKCPTPLITKPARLEEKVHPKKAFKKTNSENISNNRVKEIHNHF